ncbi:MAG: hypothetical protein E7214_14460 [Clostridium sp.]|nr:hypothetical protein [Clostridium sp.]
MRSTAYLLLFIMIVTIVIIDVLSKNKRMLNNIKNEYNNSISYTKVNFEDAVFYTSTWNQKSIKKSAISIW